MVDCWRFRIEGCAEEEERLLVLDLALGRAARCRAAGLAARLQRLATDPARPRGRLARVRSSLKASLSLEEFLAGTRSTVPLGPFVERFATLRAISSARSMRVRTRLPEAETEAPLALFVAFALCDLMQMAELMPVTPDLMLAVSFVDEEMVIGLAVGGVGEHPIPDREGMAALQRARRLTTVLGGSLDRGMRDGAMIVGITMPVACAARDDA